MTENINTLDYKSDYSENKFWSKVKSQARKIGEEAIYKILQLYYLMSDSKTPFKVKMEIMGALGYLILPVDLIPDAIPVAGYADDIGAIVFVLNRVNCYITDDIRKKARKKTDELFG